MTTINLKNYKKNIFIFFYFSFVVTATLSPLASYKIIPNFADYANHLALLIQAKVALLSGQFPLRVAPFEASGFLYPLFQFYSPSSYMFAAAIHLLLTPHNPLLALTFTFWCGLMIGGIYMYRLAYWLTKSTAGALIASSAYLSAPYYYAIVVNGLGNLNETLALGLLPAVLYYTLNVYISPKKISFYLKASLAWYFLITVHIVTFVYSAFFIGLLLIFATLRSTKHWKNFCLVGVAFGSACLMAMWYLAPVQLIQHYIYLSASYSGATQIINHHFSFKDLISLTPKFANQHMNVIDDARPAMGWVFLGAAFTCIALSFNFFPNKKNRASFWMPSLLILFFIAFFMAWSPINIWKDLPSDLQVGQYSWRILGQATWIGALLLSCAIAQLEKTRFGFIYMLGSAFLIALTLNLTVIDVAPAEITLSEFIKDPRLIYNTYFYTIDYNQHLKFVDYAESNSWLTKNPLLFLRYVPSPLLLNIQQVLPYCSHDNASIDCSLQVPSAIKVIELPALYYPQLLKITVNGKPTSYRSIISKNALVAAIKPQPGMNNIHIQFRGLVWANWVSSISFIVWILVLVFPLKTFLPTLYRISRRWSSWC